MITKVCVFCGASDGNNPTFTEKAFELGERLALAGLGLVYGAGGKGMMGAVSDGVLSRGGYVHGIIPQDMKDREWARAGLSHLETVSDIHVRKKRMYKEASVLVTIPGGYGTLDEFFESLTWSQLGYHDEPKPSYLLNIDGYYDDLRRLLDKVRDSEFAQPGDRELVKVVDSIDNLMIELTAHN